MTNLIKIGESPFDLRDAMKNPGNGLPGSNLFDANSSSAHEPLVLNIVATRLHHAFALGLFTGEPA